MAAWMVIEQTVKGKVAIVTGGGSGIGQVATLRLAQYGATVVLLDRTPERKSESTRLIFNRFMKLSNYFSI
ncbi:SDR family NAD(P)-dependent oxidoreductase [Paenibacillus spongiae]|uniref:SDR family NAD(P)-dependent oxidoreductase n=1 Tax=Paenibacillus spongiae TaxID=2909671 RepID=A0ABY5SDN5_9BACL|nr:SDR family NAD(P)-dependent oxidoreductase [Paenibacillus spongiae]UVI30615.1 SDR family NAD(P)-dependent oxidoreductase [Paenibacillus spongiae]